MTLWYADPIIAAALAEPDTDYLGDCQARTDACSQERHRRAYPGEYIATEGLALLDHDRDYLALVRRLRAVGTDGALITPPYHPDCQARTEAAMAEQKRVEAATPLLFWHYCPDCDRSYGSTERKAGLCDACREHYANTCPECDNGVVTIFHSHLRDWETGEYLDISEVPCGACEDGLLLTPVELVDFDLVAMDAYLAGADRDVDVDWDAA